jgi:hypothetical protein
MREYYYTFSFNIASNVLARIQEVTIRYRFRLYVAASRSDFRGRFLKHTVSSYPRRKSVK